MEGRQRRNTWLIVGTVSVAIMITYLFMTTRTTLWDRDEPLYARAAVEMSETGNYLFPTFNGRFRADKPIGIYWLLNLSMRVFGRNEFACRFWSATSTAASCLLTFLIGRRLFNVKAGVRAMAILASSPMILAVGTLGTPDGSTLAFTLAAMTVFVYGMTSRFNHYHVLAMGVLMGLGMLVKGPIGLLPLPVMGLTVWFNRRDFPDFVRKSCAAGAALGIAGTVFLAWAFWANAATKGEYLAMGAGRHVIWRFLEPMEGHGGNRVLFLPFYLPVIIGGFFPWTMFLPAAFSALIGGRLAEKSFGTILLVWVISIVGMMTLAATKLPHYIVFIWPALAMLSAAVLSACERGVLSPRDLQWLRRGKWFMVPAGVISGGGLTGAAFFLKVPGIMAPSLLCGMFMLQMTFLSASYLGRNQAVRAARTAFIGMVVFHIPYLFGVLPAIEHLKVAPAVAKAITEAAPSDTPIATYGFGEPSLNYYLERNVQKLHGPEQVVSWIRDRGPAVLVTTRAEYDQIEHEYGALPARVILSRKGVNYSKGQQIELLALFCGPDAKCVFEE